MKPYALEITQNGQTFLVPIMLPVFFSPHKDFTMDLLSLVSGAEKLTIDEFDRKVDRATTIEEVLR